MNNEQNTKTKLYFVRHGKTMFNTTSQVQGWSDTPLTKDGVAGAKALAKGLKRIPFTKAFSSDLGRAISTAKYILAEGDREGVKLQTLSGLREWCYGGYEGRDNAMMWDPIFKKYGFEYDEQRTQYKDLVRKVTDRELANSIAKNDPTNTAENYDQIVKRTKEALDTIVYQTMGGEDILIVTHGSELATILDLLAPGTYDGEAILNCSVTIFSYTEGKYELESLNDMSFIEENNK